MTVASHDVTAVECASIPSTMHRLYPKKIRKKTKNNCDDELSNSADVTRPSARQPHTRSDAKGSLIERSSTAWHAQTVMPLPQAKPQPGPAQQYIFHRQTWCSNLNPSAYCKASNQQPLQFSTNALSLVATLLGHGDGVMDGHGAGHTSYLWIRANIQPSLYSSLLCMSLLLHTFNILCHL